MDTRITKLLARQHSVVARTQALAQGVTSASYDGHVRRGRLVVVEHGVHRSVDAKLTMKGIALAAALRAGPRAMIAGPLVLRWMGVDSVPSDAPLGLLIPTDLQRPRLKCSLPVWGSSEVPKRVVVDGVPCAPAARCLLEGVRVLERDAWLGLVDQGDWRNRPSKAQVRRALATLAPGSLVARRATAWLRLLEGTESPGERRTFEVLGADLSRQFRRQYQVSPKIRVDGINLLAGVVLEFLGRDHHNAGTRGPDTERHERLLALGLEVIYVTSSDLDDPPALRAHVEGAIRAGLERRELGGPWAL